MNILPVYVNMQDCLYKCAFLYSNKNNRYSTLFYFFISGLSLTYMHIHIVVYAHTE